jgi:hypothetical protein
VVPVYAEHPSGSYQLTLPVDIEHHNFGAVTPNTLLGWCAGDLREVLHATDVTGVDRLAELLRVEEGVLYPARTLRLFMVTTNPEIAASDCLFYAVCESDQIS